MSIDASPHGNCDSGNLLLDGDTLRYSLTSSGFVLPLSEIRIIGECTNQNGPFADDYFLCFVTQPSGWYEASFYASGCEEFLSALGARLGVPLQFTLMASTDFASRILWPATLAGRPLFDYDLEEPTSLGSRFRSWLSPRVVQRLSTEALTLFRDPASQDG
jgi:hypothetical protein